MTAISSERIGQVEAYHCFPAKAGIQSRARCALLIWAPAFAGALELA